MQSSDASTLSATSDHIQTSGQEVEFLFFHSFPALLLICEQLNTTSFLNEASNVSLFASGVFLLF